MISTYFMAADFDVYVTPFIAGEIWLLSDISVNLGHESCVSRVSE